MRRFAAILVTLSLILTVPVSCPHALAAATEGMSGAMARNGVHMERNSGAHTQIHAHGKTHAHGQTHRQDETQHHVGHGADHGPGAVDPVDDHDTHPGCDDDCDGGSGCSGCIAVTALFKPAATEADRILALPPTMAGSRRARGIVTSFDPPPPRA